MSVSERELVAGLRILALTVKADGKLAPAEVTALEHALADMRASGQYPGLPATVDELLAGDFSIEVEEEFLRTNEARKRVYDAALLVANADGAAGPEELALLDRLKPDEGEDTLMGQILGETADTLLPTDLPAIRDPDRRDTEVREDILKYSILSAALGAIPIPGAAIVTDLAVVGLQAKMARDIARYWGHPMDAAATRSFLGTITGSVVLRVALNNLARLVPGWGSVYGAATSFASTMAIGEVVHAYYEAGGAVTMEQLQQQYKETVEKKRAEFDLHKDRIDAARDAHAEAVAELAKALREGRITQAEYEAEIAKLK